MRSLLLVLTGVGLLVGAAVLVLTAPSPMPATDFGWYAYTPLVESDGYVLSRERLTMTLVLAGLGLVVLSATAGFLVGRRRSAVS